MVEHLIKRLQRLLFKNFNLFMVSWFGLSCTPLLMSFLFDYIIESEIHLLSLLVLLMLSLVYISSLLAFFSISMWVVFTAELSKHKKIMVIIAAYLLVWFAFGNFYFATFNIDDFHRHLNLAQQESLLIEMEKSSILKALEVFSVDETLNNVQPFWQLTQTSSKENNNLWVLTPANRFVGYIDCLYFSATTILTIGFGDITPATAFLKIFVIIEGFLGQIINVLAIGLWLSKVNQPVDEDIY